MKKIIELIFPISIAVVIVIILKNIIKSETLEIKAIEFLLNNIFSLVTTLMGFTLTIITLFVSYVKSKIMKHIKQNKLIKNLLFYLIEPIILGIIIIIDIGYLATKFNEQNIMYTNHILIGIFFLSLFLLSILRIALILCELLFIIIEKPESIENGNKKSEKMYTVN